MPARAQVVGERGNPAALEVVAGPVKGSTGGSFRTRGLADWRPCLPEYLAQAKRDPVSLLKPPHVIVGGVLSLPPDVIREFCACGFEGLQLSKHFARTKDRLTTTIGVDVGARFHLLGAMILVLEVNGLVTVATGVNLYKRGYVIREHRDQRFTGGSEYRIMVSLAPAGKERQLLMRVEHKGCCVAHLAVPMGPSSWAATSNAGGGCLAPVHHGSPPGSSIPHNCATLKLDVRTKGSTTLEESMRGVEEVLAQLSQEDPQTKHSMLLRLSRALAASPRTTTPKSIFASLRLAPLLPSLASPPLAPLLLLPMPIRYDKQELEFPPVDAMPEMRAAETMRRMNNTYVVDESGDWMKVAAIRGRLGGESLP